MFRYTCNTIYYIYICVIEKTRLDVLMVAYVRSLILRKLTRLLARLSLIIPDMSLL